MAPVSTTLARVFARAGDALISDLDVSSLELDIRSAQREPALQPRNEPTNALPSSEPNKILAVREATGTFIPGQGAVSADSFNNAGMLALFAVIGAGMVVASIWFFMFAKNGGFKYRKGDWDDYKSTVLRRKGPDGRTLSNATKSTKLGGGSIFNSQYMRTQSRIAKSVVGRDEKGRKGVLGKRGFAKTHSIWSGDDYMTETFGTRTISDKTETRTQYTGGGTGKHHSKRYRDRDVDEYKREKPARVGGINRNTDGNGTYFDHSTTNGGSDFTPSEANSDEPILKKQKRAEQERERAERKAKDEVARMERRWKREAEEAAAALAREHAAAAPAPTRKSAVPSSTPSTQKQRRASRSDSPRKEHRHESRSNSPKKEQRRDSRSHSPKKQRDFSYKSGPASEVLSTAYTGTTATSNSDRRTASYYDAYRPSNTRSAYGSDTDHSRSHRQSSPRKGAGARRGGGGGYRRGGDGFVDSDLE